ncbi:hypothetical protein HDU98_003153 [Podochytrium sp. JEL0797]|nr:hypothetical protein HDU98_003153 [Podochytrium sp. JEL0797]
MTLRVQQTLLLEKQRPADAAAPSSFGDFPSRNSDILLRCEEAAMRHLSLAKCYFSPLQKSLQRAALLAKK